MGGDGVLSWLPGKILYQSHIQGKYQLQSRTPVCQRLPCMQYYFVCIAYQQKVHNVIYTTMATMFYAIGLFRGLFFKPIIYCYVKLNKLHL